MIRKLSEVEREQLRKLLEADSTAWQEAWDRAVAPFHKAFADTPEEEVMRDLEEALAEVRRERT